MDTYLPYTGIGHRTTPEEYLRKMFEISQELFLEGFTLRSGGAVGADAAFQLGVQQLALKDELDAAEIYIPWESFKTEGLVDWWNIVMSEHQFEKCSEIARQIHPCWDRLKYGVKKLHARNVLQVLGHDLNEPSKFVLYFAEEVNYDVRGGTATAVNLAREFGIPTINIQFSNWRDIFEEVLDELR